MATAQETIVTALQALRVLGAGQSPDSAKAAYCLRQLNSYLKQLAGFSGSVAFASKRISSSFEVGCGWPALRLQVMGAYTVTLPENPVDGQRVEVVDAGGTGAVVIARNGWRINGSDSNYTISTPYAKASLMFRADTGNWVLVDDLALADELPFPDDFDEAIALNLARRLTLYGQRLSEEDSKRADMGAQRIRARYAKPPRAVFDAAVSGVGSTPGVAVGARGSLNDFLNGIE